MADWNEDEQEVIRDSYWKTRNAECPRCHRRVGGRETLSENGGRRDLIASCDHCRLRYRLNAADDPYAASFRPWTADEKETLLRDGVRGVVYCPVDGSILESGEKPKGGSTIVGEKIFVITCGRCGEMCSEA